MRCQMPKIPDARQRGDASRSRFLLVGDASTRRSPSRARGLISRAHSQRPVLHEERRYWVDSSPRQPVGIAPPPPAGGLRRRVNASLPRATTGGDGGREAHNPRGGPAERWPRQGRSVSRGIVGSSPNRVYGSSAGGLPAAPRPRLSNQSHPTNPAAPPSAAPVTRRPTLHRPGAAAPTQPPKKEAAHAATGVSSHPIMRMRRPEAAGLTAGRASRPGEPARRGRAQKRGP